jgi:simple sugar transport system permease protein
LAEIPFLGKMLSGHTILVYIAIFLVAIIHFVIFHTYIGINMRAVGEKEIAATAAGVSVIKYRVIGVGIAGMLCGLAGVHLSLGYVTMFTENMTGGRGFFAYTAVVFGKANPIMVMIASFVFGFAEIATYNAQQLGFPTPLVLCLPYVVTLIALIIRNVDYKNLRPLMKDK